MKYILLFVLIVPGIIIAGCEPTKVAERDLAWEAHCDSIWEMSPEYYVDVLCETDAYQEYIEEYGEWWD